MSAATCSPPAPSGRASRRPGRSSGRTERDRLIVSFRPYVLKLARTIAEAASYHVEIDDLIGWGHMGLVEAAARFDAARGVTFRTFAHRRIQGAMFDGMRKHYSTGAALPLYDALVAESALAVELRTRCADAAYVQDRYVLGVELAAALDAAMDALSPVERAIVHHHYFDGEPVNELAATTKLSKSWLSRLHTRALAKMREALVARARTSEAYL
jgi:RNA polymerase sigma factor for flagellar operon FliA